MRVRLIITGTPIQNNLMEMHALFDLTCPGLLGDARTFKDQFERAITRGSDKHATVWERERGASTAAALRRTIAPYMLRREKKEVFGTGGTAPSPGDAGVPAANQLNSLGRALSPGSGQKSAFSGTSGASHPGALSRKNDFVVWLRLQPNQLRLYQAFLDSDSVKAVLNQTSSALAALTVLKKMCDHPALLSERAQQGIASGAQRAARRALGEGSSSEDDESDFESIDSESEDEGEGEDSGWGSEDGEWQPAKQTKHKADAAQRRAAKQARREKLRATRAADQARQSSGIADASWGPGDALPAGVWAAWAGSGSDPDVLNEMHNTGLEASCKTAFVLALLRNLVAEGHRTLVFSQSRVMLDILETGVRAEGWRLCRIDGSIASAAERQARVEAFQSDLGIPVFLLTSQVGGLGLTLTAADRVM